MVDAHHLLSVLMVNVVQLLDHALTTECRLATAIALVLALHLTKFAHPTFAVQVLVHLATPIWERAVVQRAQIPCKLVLMADVVSHKDHARAAKFHLDNA